MGLDPISMGVMAVASIAGGAMERSAARKEAAILDENGRLATFGGEEQALQTRREERQQIGDFIAGAGANGTQFSGSTLDIIAQSAFERDMEIYNVRQQAKGEADNFRAKAAARRREGDAALIGGLFSALSTTVSGLSNMKNQGALAGQRAMERKTVLGGGAKVRSAMSGTVRGGIQRAVPRWYEGG